MHLYQQIVLTILIISALIFVSCSDSGSSTGPGYDQPQPDFLTIDSLTPPPSLTQSADSYAQSAVAMITAANTFKNYLIATTPSNSMIAPKPVHGDNHWIDTIHSADLTIIIEISETIDHYAWNYFYSGSDGQHHYDHWRAMHIQADKSGHLGTFTIYEFVSSDIRMQWKWNTDTVNDIYNFAFYNYDSNELINCHLNSDNSGHVELQIYNQTVWMMDLLINWQADGSGNWIEYENGVQVNNGSWTAQ